MHRLTRRLSAVCFAALIPLAAAAQDRMSDEAREAQFAEAVEAYDAKNYERAFELWMPLAQQGDLAAQRNVAHMLRRGLGVEEDLERARGFYEQSAEFGFVTAQVNLAFMLLVGEGGDTDAENAAYWFDRAARAGHPVAQYNLAVLYEQGTGLEKNMPLALGWYASAAQNGNKDALDRLARLVPDLPGPEKPASDGDDHVARAPDAPEMETAATTPERAPLDADRILEAAPTVPTLPADIPDAVTRAPSPAEAERFMEGVYAYDAKRYGEALRIFESLAYKGVTEAQYRLARMRNRGEGEARDPVAALAWWRIAAEAGNEAAAKGAKALESELEGHRLAAADREEALFRRLIAGTAGGATEAAPDTAETAEAAAEDGAGPDESAE